MRILDDDKSVNLGSVYESVVASELIAHGFEQREQKFTDEKYVGFLAVFL